MEVAGAYVSFSGTECSTTIDTVHKMTVHSATKSFTEFAGEAMQSVTPISLGLSAGGFSSSGIVPVTTGAATGYSSFPQAFTYLTVYTTDYT